MRFIARERYGGVRRIRRAIRRELQLFADELALDLAVFPVDRHAGPPRTAACSPASSPRR